MCFKPQHSFYRIWQNNIQRWSPTWWQYICYKTSYHTTDGIHGIGLICLWQKWQLLHWGFSKTFTLRKSYVNQLLYTTYASLFQARYMLYSSKSWWIKMGLLPIYFIWDVSLLCYEWYYNQLHVIVDSSRRGGKTLEICYSRRESVKYSFFRNYKTNGIVLKERHSSDFPTSLFQLAITSLVSQKS